MVVPVRNVDQREETRRLYQYRTRRRVTRSRKIPKSDIRSSNCIIALKFNNRLGSMAAESPVKFLSDRANVWANLTASRLWEILRDNETLMMAPQVVRQPPGLYDHDVDMNYKRDVIRQPMFYFPRKQTSGPVTQYAILQIASNKRLVDFFASLNTPWWIVVCQILNYIN